MATSVGTVSAFVILSLSAILIPLAASYELKPKPEDFLNECKRKMGLECGDAININLFGRGTPPYFDDCCHKLVEMGRECHDGVVTKHLLLKPQDYADKILQKSVRVWNHCVRVVEYQERHGSKF
ncbi:protein DOWN-REGULATED IN DIF1 11-like [Punica granatum]|uniref:Prolamin-like domain-containing protein n=2 Tax=Punica granatum TaxID=22663 RepID=A0A218WIH4_PUNGR|nr:protein DOWN-REGULATED IN DIF1 11-like [Punica granatum]OWM72279.1 hypothetical protein CDL15_Pgr018164 [Punica granatum]PKI45137.1 hypothetical protein CRG98_034521 [Punica granatum]